MLNKPNREYVLKNVIGMTGLGVVVEPPLLQVAEKTKKPRKTKKGKGIGALAKLAAKALAPIAIDAASNFAKDKVSGLGVKKKRGRKPAIASLGKQQPGKVTTGQLLGLHKQALNLTKQLKKRGRPKKRAGGALLPAGYSQRDVGGALMPAGY